MSSAAIQARWRVWWPQAGRRDFRVSSRTLLTYSAAIKPRLLQMEDAEGSDCGRRGEQLEQLDRLRGTSTLSRFCSRRGSMRAPPGRRPGSRCGARHRRASPPRGRGPPGTAHDRRPGHADPRELVEAEAHREGALNQCNARDRVPGRRLRDSRSRATTRRAAVPIIVITTCRH